MSGVWAIRPAVSPVKTSPVPPLAIAGDPVGRPRPCRPESLRAYGSLSAPQTLRSIATAVPLPDPPPSRQSTAPSRPGAVSTVSTPRPRKSVPAMEFSICADDRWNLRLLGQSHHELPVHAKSRPDCQHRHAPRPIASSDCVISSGARREESRTPGHQTRAHSQSREPRHRGRARFSRCTSYNRTWSVVVLFESRLRGWNNGAKSLAQQFQIDCRFSAGIPMS
jgi:hypothetical protein